MSTERELEQVSALVDGALGDDAQRALLARIEEQPALRARWGRYHVIGDALVASRWPVRRCRTRRCRSDPCSPSRRSPRRCRSRLRGGRSRPRTSAIRGTRPSRQVHMASPGVQLSGTGKEQMGPQMTGQGQSALITNPCTSRAEVDYTVNVRTPAGGNIPCHPKIVNT